MKEKKRIIFGIILTIILVAFAFAINFLLAEKKEENLSLVADPELKRAMTYEVYEDGDEDVEGTDNVKFSAFFLRDVDGDGYAEKIKGTCKEVETEDTLYMEVIVRSEGYLKDGKIEIDGKNFYLQTAIPKDAEVKNNYIATNTSTIEFENLTNGTQKLLTGYVRTGNYANSNNKKDALRNNVNNYSRNDNKVVFTGTYVDANNHETEIVKEVDFSVDWYGKTRTEIQYAKQITYDLEDRIDEENGIVELGFTVAATEKEKKLYISQYHAQGTIPKLNGYNPISVSMNNGNVFTYDEDNRVFTIIRNATLNSNNVITKKVADVNQDTVKVVYPIEAYESLNDDRIILTVPISVYYEGYNNSNTEFENPYRSNIATKDLNITFVKEMIMEPVYSIKVGKELYYPNKRRIVSKEKPIRLYRGISSEEENDTYIVAWSIYSSKLANFPSLVITETPNNQEQKTDEFIKSDSTIESMEDVTTNIGIYFSGAEELLGEDGEIKVYDDSTGNLIHTFTSNDWEYYSEKNPFRFGNPVKHLKIVTSATQMDKYFCAYCIKELDDEIILAKYDRSEFDSLDKIRSNGIAYFGNSYSITKTGNAVYEAPLSIVELSANTDIISTQRTEELIVTINAQMDTNKNQSGWVNGSFLLKLPDEILMANVNDVSINNPNVTIESYEIVEINNSKFVKIITSNLNEEKYLITINMSVTADPRIATVSKQLSLFSMNEKSDNYYYTSADLFDIDSDGDNSEIVGKRNVNLRLVAPNGLITNQIASEYNENGDISISPQVAELKPIYSDEDIEKQTVKIGAQIKNNYSNTISEIKILGKIPFVGNTFVLGSETLNSEFSTTMKNTGIIVPSELEGRVKVYYSSNTNPTAAINDSNNGWTLKENVSDWTSIKTWLVDFENTILERGKEYTFSYIVEIPFGVEFNETAYSHHGVYFCLDTEQGKYRTRTEPNKLGITLADKYNVVLKKYQKNKNNLVEGATYVINKLDENGDVEESQTARTNSSGTLEMANLYSEKTYEIKEILSPENYELNDDIIKIVGHINRTTGVLTVEKLAGTIRGNIQVTKNEDENYKAMLAVEDEMTATIDIYKVYQIESPLRNARFKVTGEGLPENGKFLTTDNRGHAAITGIRMGSIYTIEEVKAPEGYYLDSRTIDFKVVNNNGLYELKIKDNLGNFVDYSDQYDFPRNIYVYMEDNNYPNASITFFNEEIPTYELVINKIEKGTGVNGIPAVPIEGAKFKLYRDNKEIEEFESDEYGEIRIWPLEQYVEDKDLDCTYVLKEVYAPEGYAKIKDITFKVEENSGGTLDFIETLSEGQSAKRYTSDSSSVNLIIEDPPSFKLIKKDAETNALLPNTKFAIFNMDEGGIPATNTKGEKLGNKEIIGGKEYYTLETNANGEITADLSEGVYKAVEVEADDKYDISNVEKYFSIGENKKGEYSYSFDSIRSYGQAQQDLIKIAKASNGGYFSLIQFYGTISLDGNNITSNGQSDYVLVKYTDRDDIEWVKQIGGNDSDTISSYCGTSDGGCIIGGKYKSNNIDLGNYTLTNNNTSNWKTMIIKFNNNGAVDWATSYDETNIYQMYETSDNNYLIVGYYFGTNVQIGNHTLSSNGSADGFIVKCDNSGNLIWVNSYGSTNPDYITSVCETTGGKYIFGGHYQSSSITFGNYTLTNQGNSDAVIIQCNTDGTVEDVYQFGNDEWQYVQLVYATSDGGYLASGEYIRASVEIGGFTLQNNGIDDSYLAKFNSSGEVEWATSVSGAGNDFITGIIETSKGEYLISGRKELSPTNIGDYTITGNSANDGFVAKFDKEGNANWVKEIAGTGNEMPGSIVETQDGKILVAGTYNNKLTMGDTTINTAGGTDCFLIEYKTIEKPIVEIKDAKSIGGSGADYSHAICPTIDGGYIVGGYFASGSIDIGNYTINNNGSQEAYIAKYNIEGNAEWVKQLNSTSYARIMNVQATNDGGFIAVGDYNGNIQVGETTYSRVGSYDGIVIKYDAIGNEEWSRTFGGGAADYVWAVCETTDDGFIVGGYYSSRLINFGNATLTNQNDYPNAMIIKYSQNGDFEWAKSINGAQYDQFFSLAPTEDGGAIAVGWYQGSTLTIGNTTFSNAGQHDGFAVKYDGNGTVSWALAIEGTSTEELQSVTRLEDGDYILVGKFNDSNLMIDNTKLSTKGNYDALVIKITENGEIKWTKSLGGSGSDNFDTVRATKDNGFIVEGYIGSTSITTENYIFQNKGDGDGLVVKYNNDGEIEWGTTLGGTAYDSTNAVCELQNGQYIATGIFNSDTIDFGEYQIIKNGNYDVMIVKIDGQMGANEQEEITINNYRKRFNITTSVEERDNIKGGSISGEDTEIYEKVKYGDSNTKEIVITPDTGYEIGEIRINGEEYSFEPLVDGSYTMPEIEDIMEDKNIVVTFIATDNKITINKTDSTTGNIIAKAGTRIKLDQIDERAEPQNVVGQLTDNGIDYYYANKQREVTNVLGNLTNNGTYYFVENNGAYYPTNSKTWQIANVEGATAGVKNSTAHSYIPLDLTGLTGYYVVSVNASVSSEWADYGVVRVTNNTTALSYDNSTGRILNISGTKAANDYDSNFKIEGGSTYYIHLAYRKDGSTDTSQDQIVVNSIKVYEATEESCNFTEVGGKYKSINAGKDNTVCNSYVPINLTGLTGKYNITVNAEISSETYDYGYATVTSNTDRVGHNVTGGGVQILHISGTNGVAKDYTGEVDGGSIYYLHLGYFKNASNSGGTDIFTVNSVTVTRSDSELYHTVLETNSEGKIISNIPFGKYAVTELNAPEGYEINHSIPDIEFRDYNGAPHEFTITDSKIAHVIVHHYKKGTTEKVAEDEMVDGSIGDTYLTSPKLELPRFKLEEVSGELVLPNNMTGTFTYNDIEVNYYYVAREIPLIVHHYIEGTLDGVPLANGDIAEDVITYGNENASYTTSPISSSLLDGQYELVEMPENSSGTYTYDEVEVTYYYRIKDSLGYVVHHVNKVTGEKIVEDEIHSGGKYGDSYTTSASTDIPANYEYDSRTSNWQGTLVDTLTEITYYYDIVLESKSVSANKTSNTTVVNAKDQEIDYSINYLGSIDDYIGQAKVTIVDNLTYEIDENLSNLNGGTYDSNAKTITWETTYLGIDTYSDGVFDINITKNITLVYEDLDASEDELINSIDVKLTTYVNGIPSEEENTFELEIPQDIMCAGKVIIKKDNDNWNNSTIKVELRSNDRTYTDSEAEKENNEVTWNHMKPGTYSIYASKGLGLLTTYVDTGVDITVEEPGEATIDYYTLNLNKGVGISAVSGAGVYLKGQAANIDATVSEGYTWEGWSVISGDSPN